jgi:hypothetical protein
MTVEPMLTLPKRLCDVAAGRPARFLELMIHG